MGVEIVIADLQHVNSSAAIGSRVRHGIQPRITVAIDLAGDAVGNRGTTAVRIGIPRQEEADGIVDVEAFKICGTAGGQGGHCGEVDGFVRATAAPGVDGKVSQHARAARCKLRKERLQRVSVGYMDGLAVEHWRRFIEDLLAHRKQVDYKR